MRKARKYVYHFILQLYFQCLILYESKVSFSIVVTLLRKNGLIAGLAKIDFFLEKASAKFKYCLRKI